MLKSPRSIIVLFASLDNFCFKVKVMVIESAFIHTWMSIYASHDQVTFLWQNDFDECSLTFLAFVNHKIRVCFVRIFLLM